MEKILEAKARREAEKEAERLEGLEILAKAKAEIEEDKQKAMERTMWHRRNNEGSFIFTPSLFTLTHTYVSLSVHDRLFSSLILLSHSFSAMTKANIELQALRAELAKEEAKEDAKVC